MDSFEFDRGLVFFVSRLDFDLRRVWQQRPHHQAGSVPERMHPQQLMRRTVIYLNKAPEFFLGQ